MSGRVTFTTTGATGTVLERFTREGIGDLSGEWATVRFDDGETIDVVASDLAPLHRDDHPVRHVQCAATHELRGRCQFIGYPNELSYHTEGGSHVDWLGVHWDAR